MKSFKNIGASVYRRITNEIVKPGESFTCASEKEEAVIADEGSVGIRLEEVEVVAGEAAVEKKWNLKISPEAYLERYPDGPQAELAKKFALQTQE